MAFYSTSRIIAGLLVVLWSGRLYAANGCFSSIISFGDSIADTGNLKYLASLSEDVGFPCDPPYGQNFIGQSTGRCSNGRLIIDFLAESLGLPLIPPYLSIKGSGSGSLMAFRQGVNYATGGSTAMSSSFIEAKCGESIVINGTLKDQLAWFKQSLPFICGNTNSSGMVVLCLLLLAIVFFGFQNIKT
ncbi:putative sinapine esterase [Helianthus annuus]|nr:putative sinapine esterase [Helianthus annuus]